VARWAGEYTKKLQNHWTETEISITCKWEDRFSCTGAAAVRYEHTFNINMNTHHTVGRPSIDASL